MADTYNGICKAIAVPLLVQRFGLKPDERMENWWIATGLRFRACESGRVFFVDFTNGTCTELAKESIPTYVSQIISESNDELCEHYCRLDSGGDPNEFIAAHAEMAARGISQLDTIDRLHRKKRGPAFDGL